MRGRASGICKKKSVEQEQEGKVGLKREEGGEVGGEEVKEEDKKEPGEGRERMTRSATRELEKEVKGDGSKRE